MLGNKLWFAVLAGLLTMLGSAAVSAHQDRLFEISSNGDLVGFPPDYGPASLIVSKEPEGSDLPTVRLSIRGYSVALPECLGVLFDLPPDQKILASGSWYHNLKIMPPYLNLELPQRQIDDIGNFEGYSLVFNITTLEIIEIYKHYVVEGELGSSISKVEISSLCPPDALHDLVAW